MVLLGDEALVDDRFGLFGDSANLMQNRCTVLRRKYHRLENRFGHTPIEHLGDVGHMESHFGPFGYSVSISAR
jgi:hypothetical protein